MEDISDKRREWTFSVEVSTLPGEVVCLTGSCPELGEWKASKVVPLKVESENEGNGFCFQTNPAWETE